MNASKSPKIIPAHKRPVPVLQQGCGCDGSCGCSGANQTKR
jgi:hypothetical protein